jgi:16S rRNA (adenine1518-N6/adenine1519-N6)-dimethyltransferase
MSGMPIDYPALIRKHGIRPNKRLGQHFMLNPGSLRKVLDAADLQGDEIVLEIGAGIGSLTRALASHAGHVIAIEIDPALLPALRDAIGDRPNVEIAVGDIMDADLAVLVGDREYCVVANIPYHITSNLIRRLAESRHRPSFMVLTLQQEVAQRIVARPGEMSLLALGVQIYGQVRITARIPAGSFFPKPKVDSAVIRVDFHAARAVAPEVIDVVFRLANAGFRQKRKQLANSLSGGLGLPKAEVEARLEEAGISARRRPQSLSVEEWIRLARVSQGWKGPGQGR